MSTKQEKLTFDLISKLLKYDSDSGKLYWLPRPPSFFSNELYDGVKSSEYFNENFANKEAFNLLDNKGYKQGKLLGKKYAAHRITWFLYYGEWPKNQIDHIDGNKVNNKIENLRDVSSAVNARNKSKSSNNTSGYTGVTFEKNKWRAVIKLNGKRKHIGYFETIEEAVSARLQAQEDFDFSDRHGK